MKQYIYFTLFIALITSCNSSEKEMDNDIKNVVPHLTDTEQSVNEPTIESDTIKPIDCKCDLTKEFKRISKANISFHKRNWEQEKHRLLSLNIDSLKKVTKSIRLIGFDTIPIELGVLKNIEMVLIDSRNGISGLDIFPKLKELLFWGSRISIHEDEQWLKQIEYLRLEKSEITSISSIGLLENLKQLEMSHSGFKSLVPNFHSLKCLNRLNVTAYTGDVIELGEIDLEKMPCLKYLYLQDAYNTLKGIPANVKTSNLDYIYVNNISMTKTDKQIIEKYKSR